MKQFYQCDLAENETDSIWTSAVFYCESIEEAEFSVMLAVQKDWGDYYIPDTFIEALGAADSTNDPDFPGAEAWVSGEYWTDFDNRGGITTGMLEVAPLTALAKLDKIAFDVPGDVVDAVMAGMASLHVVVDMGGGLNAQV